MTRTLYATLAATAALVLPAALRAAAASSPQQTTIRGFVGSWTCVTHSSDNKTYRETDTDTMYGDWLRVNSSYPAQNGAPASTGTTFLGYDSKKKQWVATGVGTDGSYFTAVSTSPQFNDSHWSDQYPADHGTAVLRMTQSTQYSMDTQTPNGKGKMMTDHEVCVRH
ncbi:MAG: hypothetical protein JO078_03150 [Candidatus Eremiobacteraeota bacterium]|nr:hypothetical protein [Candidatus Eremiobacteraeota bacterium]MBV9699103.1 hypothetical protein [Candidatus Eremiobacteraeota bacterium]